MLIKIKMTNQETGEYVFVFDKILNPESAVAMCKRLNEVNLEVAKFTGNAVKFFYSIVLK